MQVHALYTVCDLSEIYNLGPRILVMPLPRLLAILSTPYDYLQVVMLFLNTSFNHHPQIFALLL